MGKRVIAKNILNVDKNGYISTSSEKTHDEFYHERNLFSKIITTAIADYKDALSTIRKYEMRLARGGKPTGKNIDKLIDALGRKAENEMFFSEEGMCDTYISYVGNVNADGRFIRDQCKADTRFESAKRCEYFLRRTFGGSDNAAKATN